MIELLGKLPRKVAVAFSGGIDSVVALDFLSNNHEVTLLHFNHGETDPSSEIAQDFSERTAFRYECGFDSATVSRPMNKGESLEEYWRNMRYEWFDTLNHDCIVVAHHLDDCVETWIWSSLHGTPKTIPYKRGHNVYRPFLLNKKSVLENWRERKELTYIMDQCNEDMSRTRNYIRKELMPHCLVVNPGIHKVVKKKILESEKNLLTADVETYIV